MLRLTQYWEMHGGQGGYGYFIDHIGKAFEAYWRHLDPGGIVAIHVSSRHINLLPVVQGAVDYFHADSVIRYEEGQGPLLSNCWVLVTRRAGLLDTMGSNRCFHRTLSHSNRVSGPTITAISFA